jgi:hypothetical protein
MRLNLNLPPNLSLNLRLDKFLLIQTLERKYELMLPLRPRHIHPSKLALPQRSSDLKGR